jgi:hypothetical protein
MTGSLDEQMTGEAPDFSGSGCEIAGIAAYYTCLIASARSSLSPPDAAALVRRLRNEKIMVMRAAKDRHRMRRPNLRRARKPTSSPCPPRR